MNQSEGNEKKEKQFEAIKELVFEESPMRNKGTNEIDVFKLYDNG